jgi:UDP-N-acetylmuramyl pentapeptide phosphotransferase/UDP-N-acetylglucosamine-1-phosphate transferase
VIFLVSALVAFGLAFLGVEQARRLALRHGILDLPNERSSHSIPTPRGGGIVFLPIVAAAVIVAELSDGSGVGRGAAAFLVGGGLVAAVSWVDDRGHLPSGLRLVAHAAAAAILILALGGWDRVAIPGLGTPSLGTVGVVLTFAWIIGLTNAYNFMDGIDGIAGVQAVSAGAAWLTIAYMGGWLTVALAAAAVVAAAMGFLIHNWAPARIFMGDIGSAFLGFTLAALPLLAAPDDPHLPAAAGLVVAPFVLDTGHTFVRRMIAGENVFQAHRTHFYQRLAAAGLGHAAVAALYGGLSLFSGGLGVLWWASRGSAWPVAVAGLAAVYAILLGVARWRERRPTAQPGIDR